MEEQEPDVVLPRPSLQEYEHAKTAASEGTHLREFKDNNPGVCLRNHGFAQLIRGFSRYHSARAPNDGEFTYACNGYIQHDFLPALVISGSVLPTLEHGPYHSFALFEMSHCFLVGHRDS
jgi:hypothetical protein